jgi:hypothetical protein
MILILAAHLICINRRETRKPPGLKRAASSRKFSRWQRHQQGAIFTTHRSLYLFICITFSPLSLSDAGRALIFLLRAFFFGLKERRLAIIHIPTQHHRAQHAAAAAAAARESKKVGIREMILLSITDSAKCTTHAQRRSLSLSLFLLCNTQTPNQNHVEGRGR